MSTTLRAESFGRSNVLEQAELNADVAAGATVLILKTAAGLTTDNILYLGPLGQEACERVVISSVDSDGLTAHLVAPVIYAHKRFEPVTQVLGDQVRFYRATNIDGSVPADAVFSALQVRTIDADNNGTYYTDSTGGSDYWYKYTYLNSLSSDETDLGSATPVRGSSFRHYITLEEIRDRAGFRDNPNLSDLDVDQARRGAQAEVNTALSGRYTVPFTKPVPELVHHITLQLAAGFLLMAQYPGSDEGSNLVKDARALLLSVQNGAVPLVDGEGVSLAAVSGSGASSWPNDTTADADPEDGGGDRIFRMSDLGNRW